MKILFSFIFVVVLTGCSTTLVRPNITVPPPKHLLEQCEKLPELPKQITLSELVQAEIIVRRNYAICAERVRSWQEYNGAITGTKNP